MKKLAGVVAVEGASGIGSSLQASLVASHKASFEVSTRIGGWGVWCGRVSSKGRGWLSRSSSKGEGWARSSKGEGWASRSSSKIVGVAGVVHQGVQGGLVGGGPGLLGLISWPKPVKLRYESKRD